MHLGSNLHRVRSCCDADVEAGIAPWRDRQASFYARKMRRRLSSAFSATHAVACWVADVNDRVTIATACSHVTVLADNADTRVFGECLGWHEGRDPAIHTRGEKR